ncbi:MAG: ATP-binding protein [Aurantibacter sp.]
MEQLVESSKVGMFVKNEQNTFIYVNQAFCDHVQVSKDKILQKKHPNQVKSIRKYTRDDKTVLKTRNVIFNLIESKDTDSWIETVKFPWIDQINQLRGIYGFSYDVSDSVRAEEGLRETRIDLKKASLLNEALRQFSYAASHDLQEPIRSVQGFLHLLKLEYGAQLDKQANEYMDHADDSLCRMQQLIKDILDYAVINGANYHLETVDLNMVIDEVLQNLHQSIKEHKAHVYVDKLPEIKGNAGLLNHYFQNMLSNALKYMVPGVNPDIRVFNKLNKEKWIIGIKDNGIGIDASHFNEIFKPFKRLHRQSEYKGSGIGLATSKKIVQIHSGKLWVESTPGSGATFFMEIPKK